MSFLFGIFVPVVFLDVLDNFQIHFIMIHLIYLLFLLYLQIHFIYLGEVG